MDIFGYIVLAIYVACLVFISIYCFIQFNLLFHYRKDRKLGKGSSGDDYGNVDDEYLPYVTVQLPMYNEYFVVERLIDNIMQLDYPKDRFEVQVLDDSTDDTIELTTAKVEEYKAKGYDIKLMTRVKRKGYKAGALKDATPYAKGEFIAIFDADFLPDADFLKRTLPQFKDKDVGVVQTRWGHINQGYSILTELQAFQLNVHFTVEQKGREKGDYLLQFNGTAGLWRRKTIEDAGGWEADTLTEDLDLSYRAQLKGWKIIFLEDTVSPAELPSEMMGLKSQQHRWMKGGAETAKKLLPTVWSSDLSLMKKLHATTHLLGSTVFLSIFLVGVFSVPLLFVINPLQMNLSLMSIFLISTVLIAIVYYVANVKKAWENTSTVAAIFKFIVLFPTFLSLSMGLSLHNSIAVIQGYLGKKSAFVRTPKFAIKSISDSFRKGKYHKYKISKITISEGLLALYFLGAIIAGIKMGNLSFMVFHIMLFMGYSTIFYFSIKHMRS